MSKLSSLKLATIGTDPELFLIDVETNAVKSAIGIIPGTKEEPYAVEELGEGFAMQTDNILCEFNVPPTSSIDTFVNNIVKMKEYIQKFVKKDYPNYDILCAASATVSKQELKSDQAKQFGCDPDYNVYTLSQNEVKTAKSTLVRSAGMHIHIGYSEHDIDTSIALVKYMDAFLGVPSILVDKDTKRRDLYGKAGCFRLQPWGVEYRVLSGFWLATPERLKWVFKQTKCAITAYINCLPIPSPEQVIEAINNSNEALATELVSKFGLCSKLVN